MPPIYNTIISALLNFFIFANFMYSLFCTQRTVENKNVLVVRFHKITFTRNFLNSLGISVQLIKFCRIVGIYVTIFLNFLFERAYFTTVLISLIETVFINETDNKHAQNDNNQVLVSSQHLQNLLRLFHP